MTLYVAGKMRGLPLLNYPAFDAATKYLRDWGHIVYSPAEHSREIGFDEYAITKYDETGHPITVDLKEAIMWDLNAVAESDGIYVLEGWETSPGANLEISLAKFLNKKIIFQTP